MNTNIPLLFWLWQFSKFDMSHVNIFQIRPYSIFNIFQLIHLGNIDIIQALGASNTLDMYTEHLEYVSHLEMLLQFVTHSLLCVYSHKPTAQDWCRGGLTKQKPTFLSECELLHMLLEMTKDLDINRGLDMQKVAAVEKERVCVCMAERVSFCKSEYAQLHINKNVRWTDVFPIILTLRHNTCFISAFICALSLLKSQVLLFSVMVPNVEVNKGCTSNTSRNGLVWSN